MEILEKISQIIKDKTGLDDSFVIDMNTDLGQLGADSMDLVEIVMEIEELFGSLSKPVEGEMMLEDLLITLGAATSKREARTFITGNSVLLNGKKVTDPKKVLSQKDAMYGKYLLVRRGKKNYYLGVF